MMNHFMKGSFPHYFWRNPSLSLLQNNFRGQNQLNYLNVWLLPDILHLLEEFYTRIHKNYRKNQIREYQPHPHFFHLLQLQLWIKTAHQPKQPTHQHIDQNKYCNNSTNQIDNSIDHLPLRQFLKMISYHIRTYLPLTNIQLSMILFPTKLTFRYLQLLILLYLFCYPLNYTFFMNILNRTRTLTDSNQWFMSKIAYPATRLL